MELSDGTLMLLIESVWAVSARRAFHAGYAAAESRFRTMSEPEALAWSEDVHNAATVLVRDELSRRLEKIRARVQTLHDRAADTSYGKGQRYVLGLMLRELQEAVDAVDPHVANQD